MICPLCKGSGHHMTMRWLGLTYWPCQACGTTGVIAQHGPALFIHARRPKQLRGDTK
jgi:hypothetical protein